MKHELALKMAMINRKWSVKVGQSLFRYARPIELSLCGYCPAQSHKKCDLQHKVFKIETKSNSFVGSCWPPVAIVYRSVMNIAKTSISFSFLLQAELYSIRALNTTINGYPWDIQIHWKTIQHLIMCRQHWAVCDIGLRRMTVAKMRMEAIWLAKQRAKMKFYCLVHLLNIQWIFNRIICRRRKWKQRQCLLQRTVDHRHIIHQR